MRAKDLPEMTAQRMLSDHTFHVPFVGLLPERDAVLIMDEACHHRQDVRNISNRCYDPKLTRHPRANAKPTTRMYLLQSIAKRVDVIDQKPYMTEAPGLGIPCHEANGSHLLEHKLTLHG
jgi:hypothetical protein